MARMIFIFLDGVGIGKADETSPFYKQFKTIRSQIGEMGRITGKLMGITRYRTKEHLAERIIDIDESSDHKQ